MNDQAVQDVVRLLNELDKAEKALAPINEKCKEASRVYNAAYKLQIDGKKAVQAVRQQLDIARARVAPAK